MTGDFVRAPLPPRVVTAVTRRPVFSCGHMKSITIGASSSEVIAPDAPNTAFPCPGSNGGTFLVTM